MKNQCTPLIDILASVEDFRNPKGKRHPLPAILAVAVVAMMCGYKSYSAIAEWAKNYGHSLAKALGFTRQQPPCAATFYNIFRRINSCELQTKLNQWAEDVMQMTLNVKPEEEEDDDDDDDDDDVTRLEGVSMDGKTLRGSRGQGASLSHLLSAVSHRLGLTLFQQAVDDKTNEIPVCLELLENLVIQGRVFTVDALLTQRKMAQTIVANKGNYVMLVKHNQPGLLAEVKVPFEFFSEEDKTQQTFEVTDLAHGRIETRRLTTSTAPIGYIDWPGAAQVFRIERTAIFKNTGEVRFEIHYGITSLSRETSTVSDLFQLVQNHWYIENKSHWVRDVTFDEDRSQVRSGNLPQVMASLRNTAIGLLRLAGFSNIAKATRQLAAQPHTALELIGIQLEN